MKYKLIVIGFFISIFLTAAIGFYTLNINRMILKSVEKEEDNFKEIATAATEVSSYIKRAEGHLFLHISLHRQKDKLKFPERMKSLNENILILDKKLQSKKEIEILEKIKTDTAIILPMGNSLIKAHDIAMKKNGRFDIDEHKKTVFDLHEKFSSIRRNGVELAKLEFEAANRFKKNLRLKAENLQKNLLILSVLVSGFTFFFGFHLIQMTRNLNREIKARKGYQKRLEDERNNLKDALDKVKTLSGMFPICSSCKKIRDDEGYWNQIESYIEKHSDAQFSHGLCEGCAKEHYGIEPPAVIDNDSMKKDKK